MPSTASLRVVSALLLPLALSACATVHTRHTLTLDHRDYDALEIKYREFGGCLIKREVPAEYRLKRPRYTLELRPVTSTDGDKPQLELRVQATPPLELRIAGLEPQPEAKYAERGQRYVIETERLPDGVLDLELRSGGESVGRERFTLKQQDCKQLAPGRV